MTTQITSAWNPLAEIPVEVLRLAYWADGPAIGRDVILRDYLRCLEGLADPLLLDECLLVGLLHAEPQVRRQAQIAASSLSPDLSGEATGWTLGDPDETVRAAALAFARGAPALRALLAAFGRSADLIASGLEGCVTVADAQALAAARTLLADTELADEVIEELPKPLSADRLPSRLSVSGMRLVPAGTLRRGLRPDQQPSWGDPASPSVPEVWVDGFYLDVHPVTNEEYDAFVADVAENGHLWCHPDEHRDTNHTRSTADDPRCAGDHPATGISWYDAAAYATWCGKRLPTEDEWERAARGDEHRRYPWGENFRASQVRGLHAVSPSNGADPDRRQWQRLLEDLEPGELSELTGPVGEHQDDESPFGQRDLCGNVWEWTSTRFFDGLPLEPRFGTLGPGDLWGEWSAEVSIRGGAWSSPPALLSAVSRAGKLLVTRSPEIGFRCAVSESEVTA
jgi:formylglycine-generating enzyme required for sulfatase activity